MNGVKNAANDKRLLILAPIGRDAELTSNMLREAGILGLPCADMSDLVRHLDDGAGGVLIAEEALAYEQSDRLTTALVRQPTWSDLPIVLLTRPGGDSPVVAQALQSL